MFPQQKSAKFRFRNIFSTAKFPATFFFLHPDGLQAYENNVLFPQKIRGGGGGGHLSPPFYRIVWDTQFYLRGEILSRPVCDLQACSGYGIFRRGNISGVPQSPSVESPLCPLHQTPVDFLLFLHSQFTPFHFLKQTKRFPQNQ